MSRRFHFSSSRSDIITELTSNPKALLACLEYLRDQRYTGQILIDFHQGRAKFVAFPHVQRLELIPDPKHKSRVLLDSSLTGATV